MEEVVIIPRELFEKIRIRIGIMSDTYARDISIELDKCVELPLVEIKEVFKEIQFVDSIAFEIGEG